MEGDRKRLKKAIKSMEGEISNIVRVIAKTGSESLAAALDSKEKELDELRSQLSELERKTSKVDIDEEQISRAFDYGRELLLSGKIPRLRQLIELRLRAADRALRFQPDSHIKTAVGALKGDLTAQDTAAGNNDFLIVHSYPHFLLDALMILLYLF